MRYVPHRNPAELRRTRVAAPRGSEENQFMLSPELSEQYSPPIWVPQPTAGATAPAVGRLLLTGPRC